LVSLDRIAIGENWHLVMLYMSHGERHGIC
jgi:hypothetical protein